MDFTNQRLSYTKGNLNKVDSPSDPFVMLEQWLQVAIEQKVPEPYAMSLATCGIDKMPSVRIVLMRELNNDNIVFYSNYESAKGQDIDSNPQAEVLFFWHALERQVRIRGTIKKLDEQQSTLYFHKRPHDSQVAAWVSQPQSGVIASRDDIEARYIELKNKYPQGSVVPKPKFWGGYKLVAQDVEFWQGRSNRMHDRLLYSRDLTSKANNLGWTIKRLLP